MTLLSQERLSLIVEDIDMEADARISPVLHHPTLETTFHGVLHPMSTPDVPIHQFRGIKYASIPARFRQSKLFASYPPQTDGTKFGPICPQVKQAKSSEEVLLGVTDTDAPRQVLKQNEFECLNLNITCPAGLTPHSRIPVMVWIHGGADRGSGSHWVYDGGALVQKSLLMGRPIILVTFNFRIGLFGFAASPQLREDNKLAGEEGVGNYGLRDQRRLMDWLHHFIADFGGDPSNITLFGHGTGGADVVYHLLSSKNAARPLFQRAIVQSAVVDTCVPEIPNAGWHLSRLMAALRITTVDQLRAIEADKIVPYAQSIHAVDDGEFFVKGFRHYFQPDDSHKASHKKDRKSSSRPPRSGRSTSRALGRGVALQLPAHLQPLIIGDSVCDASLWSLPASLWTSGAVVRRLKAICQSLSKASQILHSYDLSSYTPEDEITNHVLDLINDARVAWPTDCIAQNAKSERGGRGVWRYVFDQEGPSRCTPHHAADLIYLFDTVPLPESCRPSASETSTPLTAAADDWPESFCGFDEDDEDIKYDSVIRDGSDTSEGSEPWVLPAVDEFSYARVRDTIQERWITFAHGEAPWNEEKVFVFGPEGETGERSSWIFEGRRRRHVWKEALEPLGVQVVQKIGVELSRGPPLSA